MNRYAATVKYSLTRNVKDLTSVSLRLIKREKKQTTAEEERNFFITKRSKAGTLFLFVQNVF